MYSYVFTLFCHHLRTSTGCRGPNLLVVGVETLFSWIMHCLHLLGLFTWARGDRQVESGRFPDAIVGYFPSIEPTQISPTCSDVQDLPGSLGIDTSSLVLTLLPLEYEQLCLDIYISHRLPFLPRHQYPTPLTH